jgi:succinate-semialdehyde dehydrogenase / glutarate-semialdehyde dehydrogenase
MISRPHPYAAALFIDGRDVDHSAADRFSVTNPATEAILGDVPSAGPAEVEQALAAGQRGLEAWRRRTPWERCAVLRKIAALLRERSAEVAHLLTLEVGKPLAEAATEVAVGFGREGGQDCLHDYLNPKFVHQVRA